MADQASLAKGRALGNVLVGFAMLAICLLASSVSAEGCGPRQARHVLAPLPRAPAGLWLAVILLPRRCER